MTVYRQFGAHIFNWRPTGVGTPPPFNLRSAEEWRWMAQGERLFCQQNWSPEVHNFVNVWEQNLKVCIFEPPWHWHRAIKSNMFMQIEERSNCMKGKSDLRLSFLCFFAWFWNGYAEAKWMQNELQFYQNAPEPMFSKVFCVFGKNWVSNMFAPGISFFDLARQQAPKLRSAIISHYFI